MKAKILVLNKNKKQNIKVLFNNLEYSVIDAYESTVGKICLTLEGENKNVSKTAWLTEVILIDENQIFQLEKFIVENVVGLKHLDLVSIPFSRKNKLRV